MNIETVEAVTIGPGETLAIIPNTPMSPEEIMRIKEHTRSLAFDVIVLPPGTKVCVASAQPVRWDKDGNPYGDVSDEQLDAVLSDSLSRIRHRNGWSLEMPADQIAQIKALVSENCGDCVIENQLHLAIDEAFGVKVPL